MRMNAPHFAAAVAAPGATVLVSLAAGRAAAHEAWLLPPTEIAHLEALPSPALFNDPLAMVGVTAAVVLILAGAGRIERILRPIEARLAALPKLAVEVGPIVLRLGLAVMLTLSALGGLPRHGTALWTEPTFLVPDMQLSLAPGWTWLAGAQLALALLLAAGFQTRLAGLALGGLALAGLCAFGAPFLDYAPHFAAPGLMLAILGAGRLSTDRAFGSEDALRPSPRVARAGWRIALALTGGGFVYLGLTCKLAQPALLMAVLDHGGVPIFGVPLAVVALVMAVVELAAGALLATGRLTRPVASFLIAAFTFFSVTLGENPFFHANLYGVMALLVLSGREIPWPREAARSGGASPDRRAGASAEVRAASNDENRSHPAELVLR